MGEVGITQCARAPTPARQRLDSLRSLAAAAGATHPTSANGVDDFVLADAYAGGWRHIPGPLFVRAKDNI